MDVLLATKRGVVRAERNGHDWRVVDQSLAGTDVTSVLSGGDEAEFLVGTHEGVYVSRDAVHWAARTEGISLPYVRWLGQGAGKVFAGSEPAGIFACDSTVWQGRPEVEELRDQFAWWLPYSPEAGCVRGFAFHGQRGYAAVEVGGVLRSDDGGATWRLAGGSDGRPVFEEPAGGRVHADVHSVGVHASSPDRVYAATAGGFFQSVDGGDSWQVTHAGSYCRAFWVDPRDAAHIVLGPADGVSQNGRIEETHDGGETWTSASEGLDLPWPRSMVERFERVGDELLAVTSDGRLFASPLEDRMWRRILPDAGEVRAVAPMP